MKKFTFMMLAAFIAVATMAAGPDKRDMKPLDRAAVVASQAKQLKGVSRSSLASRQKSPRKSLGLVTPPSEATPETYYTASGKLMVYSSNGFADGGRETIQVIVDGSDIYIAGLAYWVENAWIKGTIDGTTATFPAAQQVDDDASYPEWISGSEDGETPCDIVFNFDQVAGVLECTTTYIGECSAEDGFSIYAYWNQPIFTKDQPVAPEVVVLPDGLDVLPYAMSYEDGEGNGASTPINVAVDGNDVYFQGMSNYCPEAWVKGTKDGNLVTFPAMQYMGEYGSNGSSYFFYNGETVFTYDPEAATYTAEGLVFGVLADQYYDGKYTNPVLTPVVEKAAMPADPKVTGMENSSYGWIVEFDIPITDVNGEPMVASKLSYIIYSDTEGEIAPLTFTPTTHTKLTQDMTEIPYGFTENYDFYAKYIYLNDLYSEDWNKIGIQSIYRGGGEENITEIQWFDIKPYKVQSYTFDFNALDVPVSTNAVNDGDITETYEQTEGNVTLAISPKDEEASTPNRFWGTSAGPQLRVYSGTLTFSVPDGYGITQIVFNHNGKWGANTINGVEIANDAEAKVATWTLAEGEDAASVVVVSIAANSQINSIDVTVEYVGLKPIEAPEGLETETYIFSAQSLENGDEEWEDYTYQTQVGFDGNDVYFKGISNDTENMWLKGKLSEDGKTVTIPANQYMGELSIWGNTFLYFFTAIAEDGETMEDIVLNYDAENFKFTTDQIVVLHDGETALGEPYQTFKGVVIIKAPDMAATPADPTLKDFILNEAFGYSKIYASIPTKDVDGNDLLLSKLYYTVYYEKDNVEQVYTFTTALYSNDFDADVTEVPYPHDGYDIYKGGEIIYLEESKEELQTWKKVGIQSIYYGGGERHESNIIWMENAEYVPAVKEVYTEFVAETGTLTYYYDNKKNSRSGVTEVYDPVGNPDAVRFAEYYYDVTKAVIDPSMKDAELTSMKNMFFGGFDSETYNTYYLNYMTEIEGLENLNTSEVTDMKEMFYSCQELTSLDLSTFDTHKVTNMEGMFENCTRLKMLDITSFDVSNVTSFMLMFSQCTHLKTICCFGDWSSSTAQSGYMFYGCYALYGSEGTAYTEAVTDKTYARPDGGTGAPGYFTADTMTGIASPLAETEEGAIYNLAGQRMSKPQKGINIIDGKKVLR